MNVKQKSEVNVEFVDEPEQSEKYKIPSRTGINDVKSSVSNSTAHLSG